MVRDGVVNAAGIGVVNKRREGPVPDRAQAVLQRGQIERYVVEHDDRPVVFQLRQEPFDLIVAQSPAP